ncbi:hypothetical protein ECBCE011MS01_4954 [Escherichia coli BCE011_MS-01]|nr:hypothetical protein ECBCE011MS01_4954 [Escherichia coli BCE011_MS-01]
MLTEAEEERLNELMTVTTRWKTSVRNRPAGSRNEADLHGEGQAWTPEMRAGVGGGVLALWQRCVQRGVQLRSEMTWLTTLTTEQVRERGGNQSAL